MYSQADLHGFKHSSYNLELGPLSRVLAPALHYAVGDKLGHVGQQRQLGSERALVG